MLKSRRKTPAISKWLGMRRLWYCGDLGSFPGQISRIIEHKIAMATST